MYDGSREISGSTTAPGGQSPITSLHSDQTKQILEEHTIRKFLNIRHIPPPPVNGALGGRTPFLQRSSLDLGLESKGTSDLGSDIESDDTSNEDGTGQWDNREGEGGDTEEDVLDVLDPTKLIKRIVSQGLDCNKAKRVIEHPVHGISLLMDLLDNLLPTVSTVNQENYLQLAQYAIKTKPSLLSTVSSAEKMTPLRAALQKSLRSPAIMQAFIKRVCDEASAQVCSPKEPFNPCQRAIHQGDDETCLYYAVRNNLEVAVYLVEMASIDTLLKQCGRGRERQTVLHVALHNVVKERGKLDRTELIKAIIKKAPEALLEVNGEELSPYRYFKAEMQLRRGRTLADDDGQETLLPPASNRLEPQAQAEKERWKTRGSAHPLDSNSLRGGENDSISIAYPRGTRKVTQREERRRMMKEIADFLKEKCLESGTFSDVLKALYGSMEGKDATWLNLLSVELPEDFHKKLEFRALGPRMVLVAVRVPKGGGQRGPSAHSRSNRILNFFEWLRSERQVKSIMKVIVQDDSLNPSGDEVIQAALTGFDVQYLDWDRVDISCVTLAEACPSLRELQLNCSGNGAVLNGWADKKGLNALEKLKSVTIFVSQGWDSVDHTKKNLEHLKSVFENTQKGRTLSYPKPLFGKGYDRPSPTAPVAAPSTKDHKWLSLTRAFTEGLADANDVLDAGLFPRVCIIDDGASLYDQYVIKSGRSFGQYINHSSNPGECFPSVDGHGASMARIIHNLCPCINLYVAKLERAGGHGKFTMKDAEKAISWAFSRNVDVISMSWTLDKASEEDEARLANLFKRPDVSPNWPTMFCASRDQGSDQKDSNIYPFCVANGRVCNIGAADEYGSALPQTSGDATYLFPCHGLDIWGPADHRGRSVIEGSSDATALAAGLAALILACEGAVHGRQGIEYMRTLPNMKLLFNSMISNRRDGGCYVQPRLFDEVMQAFKALAASPEYRKRPMSMEDALRWRMREISDRCHSNIYSQGGGKFELWSLR